MSRVQLALNVDDVAAATAFYSKLFGVAPAKTRPGYANFAVDNPPLKLVLLENPGLQGNPFFHLAPNWAIVPLVVLATCATIIASQAIITGAFSLTRQAMQLGWFPGLKIRQTSDKEYGQIYVSTVNWAMMVCTLFLTFSFGSSDALFDDNPRFVVQPTVDGANVVIFEGEQRTFSVAAVDLADGTLGPETRRRFLTRYESGTVSLTIEDVSRQRLIVSIDNALQALPPDGRGLVVGFPDGS